MTPDPREFWVIVWIAYGRPVSELHETEAAAIADYDRPTKGWYYDHCWHVSADSVGKLQANAFDLPGASDWAARDRREGMAEMLEGPRFTYSARFRP